MKKCNYPYDNKPFGNINLGLLYLTVPIILILVFFSFCLPCQATTKCYKDICVGQTVIVTEGLYQGNEVNILDIIKETTPEDDTAQVIDYYKYFASFKDGTVVYLYRNDLKIEEE